MSFRLLMALALLGTLSEGFNAPGRGEFIGKWHGIRLLLRAGKLLLALYIILLPEGDVVYCRFHGLLLSVCLSVCHVTPSAP